MMIGAELFRQGPRPRAMSLAGLTNWTFTAVVALSFELVQVKPNSITLASSELAPNMFEAGSCQIPLH